MRQYHNPNKGAVKLAQNYTEYASNDGSGGTAAGATYNTGMVKGAEGSNFVPVNSTTTTGYATTAYKVSFERDILPTDLLFIEMQNPQDNLWLDATLSGTVNPKVENNACYGIHLGEIATEDKKSVYVQFGNAGRHSSSATYGAAGHSWLELLTWRWRVRKVSTGNFAESPQVNPSITVTGDYTVQHGIETVNVNASEASILLDSMIPSDRVTIRKLGDDATKYITITTPSGCTIEGRSELRLYGQYSYAILERVSETVFALVDLRDVFKAMLTTTPFGTSEFRITRNKDWTTEYSSTLNKAAAGGFVDAILPNYSNDDGIILYAHAAARAHSGQHFNTYAWHDQWASQRKLAFYFETTALSHAIYYYAKVR